MLENAPARLPSIVVKPATTPVPATNNLLEGTMSVLRNSRAIMIITVAMMMIAIIFLNTASFKSLPAKTPIKIPSIIQGSNFQKCGHWAWRW